MTTDTAMLTRDVATAVMAAEESIRRARYTVEELREVTASAVRVLQEAEIDSAKARLTDRHDYYLESASEHLGRLQTRCTPMRELSDDLGHHLERSASAVSDANQSVEELIQHAATPTEAPELGALRQRLDVLEEMIELAHPLVRLVNHHVDTAAEESRAITAGSLLQERSLEHSLRTATQEIGLVNEDLRMLDNVVERASANARQSTGIAEEINDRAAERLHNHRDRPRPAAHVITQRAPAR